MLRVEERLEARLCGLGSERATAQAQLEDVAWL